MEQGKGTLVPTGKHAPSIAVNYRLSEQMIETTDAQNASVNAKTVVHSIAVEADGHIEPGDYDLLVGKSVVRLKRVAGRPEWLVLSSNASMLNS